MNVQSRRVGLILCAVPLGKKYGSSLKSKGMLIACWLPSPWNSVEYHSNFFTAGLC